MIEFEQQPQFNAVSPTVSLDSQETISTLTLGKNDELPALEGVAAEAGSLQIAPGGCSFIVI